MGDTGWKGAKLGLLERICYPPANAAVRSLSGLPVDAQRTYRTYPYGFGRVC